MGGTSATITGTILTSSSAVKFGSTAASSVTCQWYVDHGDRPGRGRGTVDVTLATVGGSSATSSADKDHVVLPTVMALSPTSGTTAGGRR